MNKFMQKHPEIWKFIKFNITVIVTSALDVISYLILLYFVFNSFNNQPLANNELLSLLGIRYKGYLYSYLISTTIGYIAAYIMNRKITFHSDINPAYSSVLYFILAVFNIFVSSLIGGVFGSFIKAKNISTPIVEIISKFIIINIPTLWTYPIERYVIQIKKKSKKNIVIASDLDGTLLRNDTTLSTENIEAIERLYKKGIKTAVLTGRTFYEIPPELRACRGVEYFVFSNGAGIKNKKHQTIHYSPIPKDIAEKIFNILNSYETFIEFYSNGCPMVEKSKYNDENFNYYKIDPDFIPEMYKSRKPVNQLERLIFDDGYDIEMFDVFFRNNDERAECKIKLQKEFSDIEITTSMDNNLEIMNKGINKGFGLKKLCEIAKIDINDIIVIGDSKNDITAFAAANKKYAVSNACKEIKNMADKIICSNEENIMCYIEKEQP